MFDTNRYYTIKEISAKLQLSADALYKKMRRGVFPLGFRMGRARRWSGTELNEWVASCVVHNVDEEDGAGDVQPTTFRSWNNGDAE